MMNRNSATSSSPIVRPGSSWVRGINLGSWLNIEDFMIGLPGCDWELRAQARQQWGADKASAFFDQWLGSFLTEADLQNISRLGFNAVRLPIDYRLLEDDAAPGRFDGVGWDWIDRCLDWCKTHRLALMLDLHAAPGGQNTTRPSGNRTGYANLWHDHHAQARTLALWQELVRRFRAKPALWCYNLLNEPMTNNHGPLCHEEQASAMNRLYGQLIRAIRSLDADRPIVIDAPVRNSGGVDKLDPALFDHPATVLSYHHYPLSGNETGANFEADRPENFDVDRLQRFLETQLEAESRFAERVGCPVVLGEFGLSSRWPLKQGRAMVEAQLLQAQSHGWGWMLWSYKDLERLGLYHPRPDRPWVRFALDPACQQTHEKIQEGFRAWFDTTVIASLDKTPSNSRTYDAAWDDCQRGINRVLLDKRFRDLAACDAETLCGYAKDFALENCARREELWDVLRPFLASAVSPEPTRPHPFSPIP